MTKEPCGECHIKTGETCDICGAKHPDKVSIVDIAGDKLALRISERMTFLYIEEKTSFTTLKAAVLFDRSRLVGLRDALNERIKELE